MTRPAKINQSPLPILDSATGLGGTGVVPALDDLTDVDTTGVVIGDTIVWDGSEWVPGIGVTPENIAAMGFVGPILISDTHSTPLVFDDLLQNDDGDDLLYADV